MQFRGQCRTKRPTGCRCRAVGWAPLGTAGLRSGAGTTASGGCSGADSGPGLAGLLLVAWHRLKYTIACVSFGTGCGNSITQTPSFVLQENLNCKR